jgi:Phasin protein
MSETSKPSETAKRATDGAARSSQATIEAASKAAKDTVGETDQLLRNGADQAKQAGQSVTEAVAETANTAVHVSTMAAESSREVLMMGMRAAADVGSRVADISFGRGHHLMSSAVHAMDVYRDASERSVERVQAVFSSAVMFGRGVQQMQHVWLEMIGHSMENAAHKPQDLLRCKNLVEVAEVQRDLYLDAVNQAFESTGRLLDLTSRAAQDAVRPLQIHHH